MPHSTQNSKKNEKTVEIYIPSGIVHYITPVTTIVTTLIVCVTIILTLNPSFVKLSQSSQKDNDSYNEIASLSNFKLGAIEGKLSSFTQYENETCEKDGKPIVVMFSATWCPHCKWAGENFNDWASKQEDVEVYRYEIDTGDNPFTDEKETEVPEQMLKLYRTFNPSQTIPTYIFGCKYGRIGNGYEGESDGLEKEIADYDKAVEALK